jgi:hypothetical protein
LSLPEIILVCDYSYSKLRNALSSILPAALLFKMVFSSALTALSSFGLVGLSLCQGQYAHLKNQPADTRSHLVSPPKFGFGTWFLDISVENTTEAVAGAIVQGYRHIDGR